MQSKATTVKQYLSELPADRRAAVEAVRKVILQNLDKDYEEGIQYGMIGYYVPHRVWPDGYHCDPKQPLPFASVASQKNHLAVYMMCLYSDPESERRFREAWAKTGKKLDMGKSCIRFKKAEDLALDVIGETIRKVPVKAYLARYREQLVAMGKAKVARKEAAGSAKKPGAKGTTKAPPGRVAAKPATKEAPARKAPGKKAPAKRAPGKKAPAKKAAPARKAARTSASRR